MKTLRAKTKGRRKTGIKATARKSKKKLTRKKTAKRRPVKRAAKRRPVRRAAQVARAPAPTPPMFDLTATQQLPVGEVLVEIEESMVIGQLSETVDD